MMGYIYDPSLNLAFSWITIILAIIFWAVIIWLIISLIGWISRSGKSDYDDGGHDHRGGSGRDMRSHHPDVVRILEERYARGEINKEEFEQKRKDIIGR